MKRQYAYDDRTTFGTKRGRYDLSGRYERRAAADQRRVAAIYRAMPRPSARSQAVRNVRSGGYLGIESKFHDTSRTGLTLTAPTDAAGGEADPSTVNALNAIAQGDGESNRDGRNCVLTSIHIEGHIDLPVQANRTALDSYNCAMIALVLDTQTNGAQLNSEDVFINPSGSGSLACQPFRNLQFTQRFKVLKKKKITMKQCFASWDGTNIEIAGQQHPFTMHVDLKGMKVNFSGTTAAIANIVDNSLHLIAYCNNTELGATINYNARIRFAG